MGVLLGVELGRAALARPVAERRGETLLDAALADAVDGGDADAERGRHPLVGEPLVGLEQHPGAR